MNEKLQINFQWAHQYLTSAFGLKSIWRNYLPIIYFICFWAFSFRKISCLAISKCKSMHTHTDVQHSLFKLSSAHKFLNVKCEYFYLHCINQFLSTADFSASFLLPKEADSITWRILKLSFCKFNATWKIHFSTWKKHTNI